MPGSFLSRHRTICEVLEEIRSLGHLADLSVLNARLDPLVDEAKTYAQSMSAKLMDYKLGAISYEQNSRKK
jgi:hypothetical protein